MPTLLESTRHRIAHWLEPHRETRLNRQMHWQSELLMERIAELEFGIEDRDYVRLGAEAAFDFSRQGQRDITRLARIMYLKNPLINRAVSVQAVYVWGQGVAISAQDPDAQAVIDAITSDPLNRKTLFSHQSRTMAEVDLQVDGNLFFVLYTDTLSTGSIAVRSVSFQEIETVIRNPEDKADCWFYLRQYETESVDIKTGKTRVGIVQTYHPDWLYSLKATDRPDRIGDVPVRWDAPIYHVRVGGLRDMTFGVSEVYQAIEYAIAYKKFLFDWASIVSSYQRFAWNMTVKGGRPVVDSAKAKFGTTVMAGDNPTGTETNPPPTTGSMFIGNDATKLEPFKVAGATVNVEDSRRLFLMVCTTFGLPETFFGDVQTGNLATAKSLDRPTELKFRDRQELWRGVLSDLFSYALAVKRGVAPETLFDEAQIVITFPPILEHDIENEMKAIVSGGTLDGESPAGTVPRDTLARKVMATLGISNVEEEIVKLKAEWAAMDREKAAAQDQQQQPNKFQAALKQFCEVWSNSKN